MTSMFDIDPWTLKTDRLAVSERRLQESLTAIGNGYIGMRGNFEEGYSADSLSGTYLAGVWFPDKTRVGWWKNGYPEYFGKAVNAPRFCDIKLWVNDQPVDLATSAYRDFHLALALRDTVLSRRFTYVGAGVTVRFEFQRFFSNATKEAAFFQVKATVLAGHADLRIVCGLDANVVNQDSNYDEHFWVPLNVDAKAGTLTAKTRPNPYGVPQFTVTMAQAVRLNGQPADGLRTTRPGAYQEAFTAGLAEGVSLTIEKRVVVLTSRDVPAASQPAQAAALLATLDAQTFEEALRQHAQVWCERWRQSDVVIAGDPAAQQGIRFNLAQLFMTYYGEDARLNIGPKGFTGEKYGGATYWDTEAYVVPMYLAVTPPQITRALLQYRHDQLPGAYHNAQQQGLAGALFPMVTFNGIECHNEWEITFEEIHRNADIAFAIKQYTDYTGDETYVNGDGIEVLVAVARFWADRVHWSKHANAYMIHGVTGPNEYENNVNNNWFTNTMCAWELQYTLERLPFAELDRVKKLAVTPKEQQLWQAIVAHMYYPEDRERDLFIQHDGFLDKDLRTVDTLSAAERPLNQHWSWDKILRSPFIKQADVLQGLYFLNDRYTMAQKRANFDFYAPMTVHESSLSASVHAILAAELGKLELASDLYARTARLDLDNYNQDSDDGLHITAMTGAWLTIVQGFAGMRYTHGQFSFKPVMPPHWRGYQFKMTYRGRLLQVAVTPDSTTLTLETGAPLDVLVDGTMRHLTAEVAHV